MSRPRLLDLFCCEGGAAVGYHRAGFDVVGVDIVNRPRYPFEFMQGDALVAFEMPAWLDTFDAIHASPPCQAFSVTKHTHSKEHPDLLTPTLGALSKLSIPWVVENVPGAPLPNAHELCGAAMGCEATDIDGAPLVLRRHRLFASNVALLIPPCACASYRRRGIRVGGVYGGGPENRRIANRNLGTFRGGYTPTKDVCADLIGVDHMTKYGLSQAIPPAYTEHIGAQLAGGMTPIARRKLSGRVVGDRCGTNAGYRAHTHRGEFACRPCMDAHATYKAARKALSDLNPTTTPETA